MAIIIQPFGENLAGPWGKLKPRNNGRFKWFSNNRYEPRAGVPGGRRRRFIAQLTNREAA